MTGSVPLSFLTTHIKNGSIFILPPIPPQISVQDLLLLNSYIYLLDLPLNKLL